MNPLAPSPISTEPLRVIVFAIAGYQLALPMKAVLKITSCPSQANVDVNLLDLGGQAVRVLDLATRLHIPNPTDTHKFLLLIQPQPDQLCGIPVAELPNMSDLALPTIQGLPPSSQTTPLGQVCRYVSMQRNNTGHTELIFLLDLGLVLKDHDLESS